MFAISVKSSCDKASSQVIMFEKDDARPPFHQFFATKLRNDQHTCMFVTRLEGDKIIDIFMREEHICNTKHANNFVHAKWKLIKSKVINFAMILGDIWKHFPGGDEQIFCFWNCDFFTLFTSVNRCMRRSFCVQFCAISWSNSNFATLQVYFQHTPHNFKCILFLRSLKMHFLH